MIFNGRELYNIYMILETLQNEVKPTRESIEEALSHKDIIRLYVFIHKREERHAGLLHQILYATLQKK